MKRILLILLLLLPMHKAYAATEGNCYRTKGKAKHICMKIEEGKKFLADFKVMEHKIKTDIPNLRQQVKLLIMTQELLKTQRKTAETALAEQAKAIKRTEKVSAKMNLENKGLIVSVEKWKEEAEKAKRERWTFLLIGVGTGVVITAAVVVAVAMYAKPITVQVTP